MGCSFLEALAINSDKTEDVLLLREKIRAMEIELMMRPSNDMLVTRDTALQYWMDKAEVAEKEVVRLKEEVVEFEQVVDSALARGGGDKQ